MLFRSVEPERTVELVEAARDGDFAAARDVHEALAPLFRALFSETNPIPVKEAMEIRDYGPAALRSPLNRLSEENRAELAGILGELAGEPTEVHQ